MLCILLQQRRPEAGHAGCRQGQQRPCIGVRLGTAWEAGKFCLRQTVRACQILDVDKASISRQQEWSWGSRSVKDLHSHTCICTGGCRTIFIMLFYLHTLVLIAWQQFEFFK